MLKLISIMFSLVLVTQEKDYFILNIDKYKIESSTDVTLLGGKIENCMLCSGLDVCW